MLPDEDGYSILSKLKKDSRTQDVPVIMLTAKSSELDKVSGLEMGAEIYNKAVRRNGTAFKNKSRFKTCRQAECRSRCHRRTGRIP